MNNLYKLSGRERRISFLQAGILLLPLYAGIYELNAGQSGLPSITSSIIKLWLEETSGQDDSPESDIEKLAKEDSQTASNSCEEKTEYLDPVDMSNLDILAMQPEDITKEATAEKFLDEPSEGLNEELLEEQLVAEVGDNPDGELLLPPLVFEREFTDWEIEVLVRNQQAFLLANSTQIKSYLYEPSTDKTKRFETHGRFRQLTSQSRDQLSDRFQRLNQSGLYKHLLTSWQVSTGGQRGQVNIELRFSHQLNNKLTTEALTSYQKDKSATSVRVAIISTSDEISFKVL